MSNNLNILQTLFLQIGGITILDSNEKEIRECETCDVDESCDNCIEPNSTSYEVDKIMTDIRNKYLSKIATISSGRDVQNNYSHVQSDIHENILKSGQENGFDSVNSTSENYFSLVNRNIESIEEEPMFSDEYDSTSQNGDCEEVINSKNPFLSNGNFSSVNSFQENKDGFGELDTKDVHKRNLQSSYSIDDFLSNSIFFDEPFQKYCSDNDIYLKSTNSQQSGHFRRNKSANYTQAVNIYRNNFFDSPVNYGHSSSVPALNLLDSKRTQNLVSKPPIPSPRISYTESKHGKDLQTIQNEHVGKVSNLSQAKSSSNPFLNDDNTDIPTPVNIESITYVKNSYDDNADSFDEKINGNPSHFLDDKMTATYDNMKIFESTGKNRKKRRLLLSMPTNSEFNENGNSKFRTTKNCVLLCRYDVFMCLHLYCLFLCIVFYENIVNLSMCINIVIFDYLYLIL